MGQANSQRPLSRRGMLKITGAAGVGAATGVGAVAFAARAGAAEKRAAFVHPGLLHTQADFDRMAEKVAATAQPWMGSWELLVKGPYAQADYAPRPLETAIRGGAGQNYAVMFKDVAAAYQNALRWKIADSEEHGDAARDILNAWSGTLRELSGNADRYLLAGIQGWQFANAGEIMRDYPGFELDRFQSMLVDIFYPLNDRFLREHNDSVPTNYRANWDLCNMASIIAIGGFTEDQAKIDQAVDYFKNGEGNGSIRKAVNVLHEGEGEEGTLGQWEESGRDQGHTMAGVGWMGVLCEMAWNLGEDLYGYDDNRFMKGCEYVSRYNIGKDVPYTEYSRRMGQDGRWYTESVLGEAARGDTSPIWAMIHNHYAVRRGLDVPNITAWKDRISPEDGGGYRGPNSGGFDHLGFGTLTFTQDPDEVATPTPGATAGASDGASGGTDDGARPQGGGKHLAETGSAETVAWSAAAGTAALVGGLLLLRRRRRDADAPESEG